LVKKWFTEGRNVVGITAELGNVLLDPEEGIALIDKSPVSDSKTAFGVFRLLFEIFGGKEPKPSKTVLNCACDHWLT
jgi:hypothetical protein